MLGIHGEARTLLLYRVFRGGTNINMLVPLIQHKPYYFYRPGRMLSSGLHDRMCAILRPRVFVSFVPVSPWGQYVFQNTYSQS